MWGCHRGMIGPSRDPRAVLLEGGRGTHAALGPAPALETDAVGVACGQGVGEGGEGSWMGSGVQQTGRNSQLAGGGRSEIRGRRSEQSSKT